MTWHYSRAMPSASVRYGVWEKGVFVGCVLFGVGAAPNIGRPYGLTQPEVMELVRVALAPGHVTPTSRVVAIALRLLRKDRPGLRLVVSYADPLQGHHGGIYAAGGWMYVGPQASKGITGFRIGGAVVHRRSLNSTIGTSSVDGVRAVYPDAEPVWGPPKHKFVLPLDSEIRARVVGLAKPYPKRSSKHADSALEALNS